MEIVINIPDITYSAMKHNIGFAEDHGTQKMLYDLLYSAVTYGTPLPTHHGRIIDENQIRSVTTVTDSGTGGMFKVEHDYIVFTDAPTILEANMPKYSKG